MTSKTGIRVGRPFLVTTMLLRSPCRTRVRRLNARGGAVRSSLIRWGEKCPRPWPEALPRQRSRRAA